MNSGGSALSLWGKTWGSPVVIMAIIFAFSSIPGDELSKVSTWMDEVSEQVQASFPTIVPATPDWSASGFTPVPSIIPAQVPTTGSQHVVPANIPEEPHAPLLISRVAAYFNWLKFGHIFWFAWLSIVLQRAFQQSMTWHKAALMAVLACAIYAGLDEFHQSFVPQRSALLLDACLDTATACVVLQLQSWMIKSQS